MSSIRDYCPLCKKTGWECTCAEPEMTNETRTPSPADGRRIIGYRNPAPNAAAPMVTGATDFSKWTPVYEGYQMFTYVPGSVAGAVPSPIEPQPDDYSGAEVFDPGDGKPLCPMCDDTGEVETEDGWVQRCSCQDDHCGIVEVDPADFETPMQAVTRAIMEAEPAEGFPVAAADELAFRYGKDVALAAARETLSSLGLATHATADGELIDAQRAGEKIGRAKGIASARKVFQRHTKHGARL